MVQRLGKSGAEPGEVFDLLLGYTGIVSFAHTMLFGIGAYGVAIASTRMGAGWAALGVGIGCALALSFVLALAIGLGALLNAGWLLVGLVRRGAYRPSPGWARFGLQVLAASALLAALRRVLASDVSAWGSGTKWKPCRWPMC